MKAIRQQFAVNFEYEVIFTDGVFDPGNLIFHQLLEQQPRERPSKIMILIDDGVDRNHPKLLPRIKECIGKYPDLLELCGNPMVLPGGEKSKNSTRWLEKVLKSVDENKLDRHSYLVAIGGGAFLDTVGFATSIAHRGIRHIRIPTTVLSQLDSGLGVKNGINYFGKKNFVGTFTPPYAVINDFGFLYTLSDRDWRSGIAEAIKVSLIKDRSLFSSLERHSGELMTRDLETMKTVIYECAKLHLDHISSGDAFELGSSRPLDFGHWAAHKLEQMTDYELRHGEAVALGLALDSTYSFVAGMLPEDSWKRIIRLLKLLELEVYLPEMSKMQSGKLILLEGLEEFREHLGGELTIMLLKDIGEGVEVNAMDNRWMEESIKTLAQLEPEVFARDLDGSR